MKTQAKPKPKTKVCRRCKLGYNASWWECRTCGAKCCEHLCSSKVTQTTTMPGSPFGPGAGPMPQVKRHVATCSTCARYR